MRHRTTLLSMVCASCAAAVVLAGCEYPEEDMSQAEPQAKQVEQPQQAPQYGGGMANGYSTGGNSTLGAAKRGAEGIINNAEQASQNTANQADKMMNPHQ